MSHLGRVGRGKISDVCDARWAWRDNLGWIEWGAHLVPVVVWMAPWG